MDNRTSYAASATRRKTDSEAGRGRGAHREIRIAKILGGQSAKRDCLVRLADQEGLRHISGRIVVSITCLRSRNRTGTRSGNMNSRAADAAVATGNKTHCQAGRSRRADREIRIAKGLRSQCTKRDGLACLAY